MSLLAEHSLRIREGLFFAAVQGEGVLLDLVEDRYWGLYDLGAAIWKSMMEGLTREQTIDVLVASHRLAPREATAALEQQIGVWTDSRLLVPRCFREGEFRGFPEEDSRDGIDSLPSKACGSPATQFFDAKKRARRSRTASLVRVVQAGRWAGSRIKRMRPVDILAELSVYGVAEPGTESLGGATVSAFRALQWFFRRRDDCLFRSLTLARALRVQGVPCDLCFGVRKIPFWAHAWVELDGHSVDSPTELASLTVVARF